MVEKHIGDNLPVALPSWLVAEGVRLGARIINVEGIGSKDRKNKTDVIIYLENSEPIKNFCEIEKCRLFW